MAKEFHLELDPSIDEVIDEVPGNSFIALRKLRWSTSGPFKLDIRKWFTSTEGEEIAGKGVSFMTEEGPANLIEVLLKHGYGDTRKTLDGIKDREDFASEAISILADQGVLPEGSFVSKKDDDGSGSFYDPKDLFDDE